MAKKYGTDPTAAISWWFWTGNQLLAPLPTQTEHRNSYTTSRPHSPLIKPHTTPTYHDHVRGLEPPPATKERPPHSPDTLHNNNTSPAWGLSRKGRLLPLADLLPRLRARACSGGILGVEGDTPYLIRHWPVLVLVLLAAMPMIFFPRKSFSATLVPDKNCLSHTNQELN